MITLDDIAIIKNKQATFAKDKAARTGWPRIMSYYKPIGVSIVMMICAAINSLAFPLLGLCTARFQFIIATYGDNENWVAERNTLVY